MALYKTLPKRRKVRPILIAVVGGAVLVTGLTATSATAEELTLTHEVPAGASKVWIEIESPLVNVQNTRATLKTSGDNLEVDLKQTAFGAGSIIDAPTGPIELIVDVSVATKADITLTYEGEKSAVLRTDHRRAAFNGGPLPEPADPTEPSESSSPTEPTAPTESSNPTTDPPESSGPTEPTTSSAPTESNAPSSLEPSKSTAPGESTEASPTPTPSRSPGDTSAPSIEPVAAPGGDQGSDDGPQATETKNKPLAVSGFASIAVAIAAFVLVAAGGVFMVLSRRRKGAHR